MIRDVEESLRQEQLQKLWDDYGTMIVAAAVSVHFVNGDCFRLE